MSWRFRRSMKVLPGVRVNVGKTGITSVSVGGRGARATFGKRGVRQTVGLPGTGLSFTSNRQYDRTKQTAAQFARHTDESIDLARFGISPTPVANHAGRTRVLLFIAGGALAVLSFTQPNPFAFATVAVLVVALMLPSRRTLERREFSRCQALASAERVRRVDEFNFAACSAGDDLEGMRALLRKQEQLALTDEEVGADALRTIRASIALKEFELAASTGLPAITEYDQIVAPDICYFGVRAIYDKRGDNDPDGTLYLTDARALFVSRDGTVPTPWAKVISVAREHNDLQIQRRDRKTPYVFYITPLAEAMKAEFVANHLFRTAESQRSNDRRRIPTGAVRVRDLPISDESHIDLGSGAGFTMGIVGESYRQRTLRALSAGRRERDEEVTFTVALVREPENPYDPNAVRVDLVGGEQVGYLAREDAAAYQLALRAIPAGNVGVCRARLIGGTPDKPSFGVMIDLQSPEALLNILPPGGQPF